MEGKIYELDTADWDNYKNWIQDDYDRAFAAFVQSEVQDMAEHLLGKRWSVVFSEADTFITTDKPVVLHHQTRKRFGWNRRHDCLVSSRSY